ncbi:PEP-CTERM sorting domain-containing protein [Cerasicoccus fimbriatus]|uniref:PEP-CTERM sorting domain-containing protein n=1 Tax=Cerasicoccus fimbriatus TaxID=3014554 RepID=UPI0022B3B907|nr:PEP-CTERM sorting domain-containing protein [Cerasicoccus sp. TK19100]
MASTKYVLLVGAAIGASTLSVNAIVQTTLTLTGPIHRVETSLEAAEIIEGATITAVGDASSSYWSFSSDSSFGLPTDFHQTSLIDATIDGDVAYFASEGRIGPSATGGFMLAYIFDNEPSLPSADTSSLVFFDLTDKRAINMSSWWTVSELNAFDGMTLTMNPANGTDAYEILMSVNVTPVPEPGTYALIAGAAVLGLVAYRRRK